MDNDIIGAFNQRYINYAMNASGYGNNALNVANYTRDSTARYKKPY